MRRLPYYRNSQLFKFRACMENFITKCDTLLVIKHIEMLYTRVQKQHYCFLCFAFPRCAYRQHATNTTVKLFQFHAFCLEIDNFLGNSSKISRDHGTVRGMRRIYTESREAVIKRNGNIRVFVYSSIVLGLFTNKSSASRTRFFDV